MIEFRDHITAAMLQAEPQSLFVFGDNLVRKGRGGQAAVMRGAPNAVGIPTKIHPSLHPDAFFSNADFDRWKKASLPDWKRLFHHARLGGHIVWPKAGIGTGRARLQEHAPDIAASIARNLMALSVLCDEVRCTCADATVRT